MPGLNGMVTMETAEDIVFLVNGHFFRGAGRLIRHFFRKPEMPKQ